METLKNMADREKVKEASLGEKGNHYHKSQYENPKRSTIALCDFVGRILPLIDKTYNAIDVGCGGGANMYYLSKILPGTKWTGLDFGGKYFDLAKQYSPIYNQITFVQGDFYELSEIFPNKSFDLAFSIQNLSWLPDYEEAMKEIMVITKKWIFLTSLFSDFNVDIFSEVIEYDDEWSSTEGSPYNYNVYSYGKFKDFCLDCGAQELISEYFIIDIDLPMTQNKQMGTYTLKDINEKRLQFSGPLYMPWKMIAIRME
jgi:hypothetical protein